MIESTASSHEAAERVIGIHAIGALMIAWDERGAVSAARGLDAASSSTFKGLGTHGYAMGYSDVPNR